MVEQRLTEIDQLIQNSCDNYQFQCYRYKGERLLAAYEESASLYQRVIFYQNRRNLQRAYFYAKLYLRLVSEEGLSYSSRGGSHWLVSQTRKRELALLKALEMLKAEIRRQIIVAYTKQRQQRDLERNYFQRRAYPKHYARRGFVHSPHDKIDSAVQKKKNSFPCNEDQIRLMEIERRQIEEAMKLSAEEAKLKTQEIKSHNKAVTSEKKLDAIVNAASKEIVESYKKVKELGASLEEISMEAKDEPLGGSSADVEDEYSKLVVDVWKKKNVPADGHCAFRSIAQGIANGKLSYKEETESAMNLRQAVCKLLLNNKDELIDGSQMTIEQLVMIDPQNRYESFADYVEGIEKSDYAGEMELIMLSRFLERPIYVYFPNGIGYTRIRTYGKGEFPVCIVWEKGFSEGSNHYNALIRS